MMHGWYSEKMARVMELRAKPTYPCLYATPTGGRVFITFRTKTAEKPPNVKWDDLVYVGEITDCLRLDNGHWVVAEAADGPH